MDLYANEKVYPEEWDYSSLIRYTEAITDVHGKLNITELDKLSRDELREALVDYSVKTYEERENSFGSDNMRELEKVIMLRVVDNKWMDQLDAMDMLREGIGLRAYGQRDPLIEYKIEAFDMFQQMLENIQEEIVSLIYKINIIVQPEDHLSHAQATHGEEEQTPKPRKPVVNATNIGRNDPCTCNSGKKYKKCCGAK